MQIDELIELARQVQRHQSEAQTIEVKAAAKGCPKRLYDTLSSFSNQDSGGILLFGLDESQEFQAVGVYDLQDLQKKVTEQCNQMEPPVRAVFTYGDFEGVAICSAEIPSIDLPERPCYYRGAGRLKGSYVRVGDADLPMTEYEIYSFEAFRKHLHDDERCISRASFKLLDQEQISHYLLKKRAERPGFAKMTEEQALEMLNITRDGTPTLAAVLCFGIYPQGYLPQMAITAIVVQGTETGNVSKEAVRFIDNKRIEGTLSEMLEDSLRFCQRNMKVQTIIDPKTGKRADRLEYPINALREAILNALIHRDYSIYTEGTPIQLNFFSDRVEIHSPGGLYGRMTVEQLGIARPDLRNPALAIMAETLTSAENRYSGIPTIRREMKENRLPEPVFENRRNEFVVTLYNGITQTEQIPAVIQQEQSLEEMVLRFCAVPRSRQEIAELCKIKTVSYVSKNIILPLVEAQKLEMTLPQTPKSRNQKFYAKPNP